MVHLSGVSKMIKHLVLALSILLPTAAAAEFAKCTGQYALCDASTCTPTGKTITTTSGATYPEVICRCPILHGSAVADLSAGNMTGSCDASGPNHVWSLYAPRMNFRQEWQDFSRWPQDKNAKIQVCGADLMQGANSANCFSFDCEKGKDGIAICHCPMGQVPANTAFVTLAGQGDPAACSQHPVSLPLTKP